MRKRAKTYRWSDDFDFDTAYKNMMNEEDFFDTLSDIHDYIEDTEDVLSVPSDTYMYITVDFGESL